MSLTKEIKLDYDPNIKQAEAHTLAAKYRGFCGGWGNGKTTWGCVEFLVRLLEYPGTNSIIARKTRPELRSTTWDMLLNGDSSEGGWRGIPKEIIAINNKSDLYVELRNGSKIHGLPLDDPKKIENYNLGLYWIDQAEEVEEDIFLKFQGRLRQHHSPREGLLTFNPNGHNWLWKRFINPKRNDHWKRLYQCIEATTMDNPNLPSDYMEQFVGLPDHWYQRFIMGSHEVFTGQIFTDYFEELHVIQPFRIPSHWERYMCMDPGIRHEGCLSWMAQDPMGNMFYYREILEANQPIEWWAAQMWEKEADNDFGGPDEEIFRRFIGPEARIRAQTDGRSVYDVLGDYGIHPEIADRDPVARISVITSRLRPRDGHVHPFLATDPAPSLYIFDSCEKFKEYLPQYRWRPVRTNFSEEDSPEKPRKKDDHNIDCAGHILVAIGDDPPDVEGSDKILDAEQREMEEHFDRELAIATQRQAARGYSRGRYNSTVG